MAERRKRHHATHLVATLAVVVGTSLLGCSSATGVSPDASVERPCAPSLANTLRTTASTRQLVTVEAADTSATWASVRLWQRAGRCFVAVDGPWPARVGWSGLSSHHREGDGSTPMGRFGFGPVLYGNAADPGVRYRYHRLVCGDWWDEDPASPLYNRFVHVRCGTPPSFHGGSEALWTETEPYPYFAVIAYNSAPIVPGRGSAIFLHAETGSPTNGCVAIPLVDLRHTLAWLRPAEHPLIVIGVRDTIAHS